MLENRISLTGILSYKGRMYDSIFIWENACQRKTVFWDVLHSDEIVFLMHFSQY